MRRFRSDTSVGTSPAVSLLHIRPARLSRFVCALRAPPEREDSAGLTSFALRLLGADGWLDEQNAHRREGRHHVGQARGVGAIAAQLPMDVGADRTARELARADAQPHRRRVGLVTGDQCCLDGYDQFRRDLLDLVEGGSFAEQVRGVSALLGLAGAELGLALCRDGDALVLDCCRGLAALGALYGLDL